MPLSSPCKYGVLGVLTREYGCGSFTELPQLLLLRPLRKNSPFFRKLPRPEQLPQWHLHSETL